MKIGRKQPQLSKRSLAWLLLLLLAFASGLFLGDRGLFAAARRAWADRAPRPQVAAASLPTLMVDISFQNYEAILSQREEALATGVFIGTEADFVPATLRLGEDEIPVRLRLEQGVVTRLSSDAKWNFEGRAGDDPLLFGMGRFYLLNPADNNWFNEWAFHETLRREGVLATRYQFVHLIFNGDDWGIYAVQEGFDPQLLQAAGRQAGVMVEFDAAPLWAAVAAFDGDAVAAIADPVTNLAADDFPFFEVDAFRDATIARDEALSAGREAAIGLLRGLQKGELAASEVFDVARYGRFLALTDLWGAIQGTALVNLRYYYDPEDGRLEPIGFNGNPLSSEARLSLAATYHDPALQAAYVAAAERYSQPTYLAELQAAFAADLLAFQAAFRAEASPPLPWDALAQRQEEMRRSLNPLQPVFAYLGPPTTAVSATIEVDVANVLNLPVEVVGFDVAGATFLEADAAWLQEGPAGLLAPDPDRLVLAAVDAETAVLRYARFSIPITAISQQDNELDFTHELDVQVATRILGLERAFLTPARPGYPDPLAHRAQVNGDDVDR